MHLHISAVIPEAPTGLNYIAIAREVAERRLRDGDRISVIGRKTCNLEVRTVNLPESFEIESLSILHGSPGITAMKSHGGRPNARRRAHIDTKCVSTWRRGLRVGLEQRERLCVLLSGRIKRQPCSQLLSSSLFVGSPADKWAASRAE